jgi:aromatic ring hydroxylase
MNRSNFLNSLRDETIQEYLNSDRNRSSFLAHQIKDSVSRFEGAIDPEKYEAINELELRNASTNVDEIKKKLLDTFNNLTTLADDTDYETTAYSKLYNAVGNYTTVLVDYNKLVTLYLTTTNNFLTRQKIYATLMETKQVYSQLGNLTLKILLDYDQINDPKIRQRTIIKYFVKVLLLTSLFAIIAYQFNTGPDVCR